MRHPAGTGFLALAALLLIAGCNGSSGGSSLGGTTTSQAASTRYDLANGCYAMRSVSRNTYAVHDSDGGYSAISTSKLGAEPLFMKPTALGKYLIFAKDESFLSAASPTGSTTAAGDVADWTVNTDASHNFTLFSASAGKYLSVAPDTGVLTLADSATDNAGKFRFDPTTGCATFPEAQVNATGDSFKGKGVDKPVLGFADVHLHISATHFLGGGHYGSPFARFGITEALNNCSAVHGPNGSLDVIGNFLGGNPVGQHDTQGWPTFVDWPARGSLMHEGVYYKWLERAWKAGLRIVVNDLVENETLCNLESKEQGQLNQNCNEMESAVSQVQFMHDMQDYIDAQEGGPGKGWFRLVTTPAQARQVINQGKLAVVLGIEISHLFNCKVTQIAGQVDMPGCDKTEIDTQLDRLYGLGVREMFPIHEFDNAFGGNGIFDGFVLNIGNFADTGQFWKTYDCPTQDYFYDAGAIMTTADPTGGNNPISQQLLAITNGILPIYPGTRQCNARTLTDLGQYALQEMMKKKIIIELDHLELKIKSDVLTMAEGQNPPYPVVSTHGGHGGISIEQARRIMNVGGILYPSKGNGAQWNAILNKLTPLKSSKYFFGMGYGADMNGLATQASPRGSDAKPVVYPFTLFKGADWGPQFAGMTPVTFDREVSGQRVFDVNNEGTAHYGLIADFVEEVRLEGGQPALNALYNSAEAYLEMWERVTNR